MTGLVADTHAAVWYFLKAKELSANALALLDQTAEAGESVYLSSISVVEIIYLVEKGRLPEAALQSLMSALASPGSAFEIAPLDLAVSQAVRRVPRDVIPDMPDRIITATALSLNLPLVTRDERIRAVLIRTIW